MGTSRQPRNLLLPLAGEIKRRGLVGAEVLRSLAKAGTALEPGGQGTRGPCWSYTGDIREGREGPRCCLLPPVPLFGSASLGKSSPLQYRAGEGVEQNFRYEPKMLGPSAGAVALLFRK